MIDIMSLPQCIKLGYAVFFDHIHTPELLRSRAMQLFDWVREGKRPLLMDMIAQLPKASARRSTEGPRKCVAEHAAGYRRCAPSETG